MINYTGYLSFITNYMSMRWWGYWDAYIFPVLSEWIKSDDKWLRRLAVATIPPYIRARKNEAKVCLE